MQMVTNIFLQDICKYVRDFNFYNIFYPLVCKPDGLWFRVHVFLEFMYTFRVHVFFLPRLFSSLAHGTVIWDTFLLQGFFSSTLI